MNKDYTPLDVDKMKGDKNNPINTVLLVVATFTALVLVVLLFVLIQKKSQPSVSDVPQVTPTAVPTVALEPTVEPTPVSTESSSLDTSMPIAATSSSESAPTVTTVPAQGATQSSQIQSP